MARKNPCIGGESDRKPCQGVPEWAIDMDWAQGIIACYFFAVASNSGQTSGNAAAIEDEQQEYS